MFQELEFHLQSEINTLSYPKAALFGFCVVPDRLQRPTSRQGGMRQVHGEEKIRNEVPGYYLAGGVSRTHEGMTTVVDPEEWSAFQIMA